MFSNGGSYNQGPVESTVLSADTMGAGTIGGLWTLQYWVQVQWEAWGMSNIRCQLQWNPIYVALGCGELTHNVYSAADLSHYQQDVLDAWSGWSSVS